MSHEPHSDLGEECARKHIASSGALSMALLRDQKKSGVSGKAWSGGIIAWHEFAR